MEQISESNPQGFLLIHNISKGKNIGTLVRSACAFNFSKIFIISRTDEKEEKIIESDQKKDQNIHKKPPKLGKIRKELGLYGNQGTDKQIEFQAFTSIPSAKEYFIKNKIFVCGVEITNDSQSVVSHPFKGSTVFFLGNEGVGLHEKHKEICDHFVYIPQYTDKTASLNVAIAGSIIFHHFAVWAGFKESKIYGEKFQKKEIPRLENIENDEKKEDF